MTKTTPTKTDTPALTFTETTKPVITRGPGSGGRSAAPNPYTDIVKSLADTLAENPDSDRAITVTISGAANIDGNAELRKVRRWLNLAGDLANVTVNWNLKKDTDTTVAVTFWVRPKVKRPRKPTETTETASE